MRKLPFHGPGGPTVRPPHAKFTPRVGAITRSGCRSPDQPAAACGGRAKPPGKRAIPADAFCPEGPCPQAPTQASRKCQFRHRRDPQQSRGFSLRKLNHPHVLKLTRGGQAKKAGALQGANPLFEAHHHQAFPGGTKERDSELTPAVFLIMILQYFTSGLDLNSERNLE